MTKEELQRNADRILDAYEDLLYRRSQGEWIMAEDLEMLLEEYTAAIKAVDDFVNTYRS